ncbi:MAG: hypothetical protein E5V93_17635, partial [Mesorhizobium sp.]
YINSDLPFEDRCAAEAALTLLLDDASSKVRQALAAAARSETLAVSIHFRKCETTMPTSYALAGMSPAPL